jgi:hypothetical protein
VLISVRPRLFASVLGRLLDSATRNVTVVDPDDDAAYETSHDVAVISHGPAHAAPGAAVISLPDPEQDRPAGTLRIASQYEIVRVMSPSDLVAVIDRAGAAVRNQG